MSFWTKYVLCVTESNAGDDYSNTDQVLYFDSTPTSTVSSNGLLASAGFGGIAQDVVTHPQYPEYSTTSAYSLGDTILGAYVTSSTAVESTASTGFMNWFIPSRGMSANCESQRPIQFGVDLDDWCVVEVEALSTSCTAASTALLPSAFTSLDSLSYGSMLHVASSPTTVPGSSTGWIRSYVRAAAGVTEHEQLESAADAGIYDSLIQPKWDSTLTTCMNTMHNLTYHVTYSASSGAITMVNVSVAVGNTTMKTDGDASITQGFSVRWYADGGTPEYARDRSGSPGYIEGLPVLGAASSTSGTKTAYLQSTDGARVLGAGPGGVCSNQTHNPILFNTAMKTECSISFASATELETYCGRSLTSAVGANLPWPLGGPLTWSFVGMLGNAEPRYTGNWTTVVESGTAPTASWLSSVSTCSSIVSGIEIDFVVANTGERVSPQAAIIGAQVSYVSESWAFKNIATVDGAQTFTHSVTVRWHEYDNNIYERMPGFTPTETTMPDDVLHPFYPFN